jgi:hypothetical protein
MINQIKVELSAEQAAALAQLCKRWRHDIARSISVDDAEADEMMSAIDALRAALAEKGHAPR